MKNIIPLFATQWRNIKRSESGWTSFKYLHFYASYDYTGDSRKWYDREIRIIRNDKAIRSHRDAQGFRKNGQKLHVKEIEAYIYHYGWVKHPQQQLIKIDNFGKLWRPEGEHQKFQKLTNLYTITLISIRLKFSKGHIHQ